ncbi:hypothetical protein Ocin01_17797, partial [Orchesella cincta]
EQIVMTPKAKTDKSTTIAIERRRVELSDASENRKIHVAGGDHTGIIINKQVGNGSGGHHGGGGGGIDDSPPHQLSLEFKVFLVNTTTQKHTLESRQLRFWLRTSFRWGKGQNILKNFLRMSTEPGLAGERTEVTERKLLEMIECAYPNPMSLQEIAKQTCSSEEEVRHHILNLQSKGLIKSIDKENSSFTRVVLNETNIRIVKQMPKMVKAKQPSIAIITAHYCEKLAVDAMIENQETFVRYTTVGESNVYTLGNMGNHGVVSTKLPSVGHTREAMIAAGNTTTRLLGTFQKVDYVFLIGVGGGVPISRIITNTFVSATLCLGSNREPKEGEEEWASAAEEGMSILSEQDCDFARPPATSDKLYMAIGEKDVIEVAHPAAPVQKEQAKKRMESRVHLGPVASGRMWQEMTHQARTSSQARNSSV